MIAKKLKIILEEENGIGEPSLIADQKNNILEKTNHIWFIIIKMNHQETELATLIHGSNNQYIELFTSKEKAEEFWKLLKPKLESHSVSFSHFKSLEIDKLFLYLDILKKTKIKYRINPHKRDIDQEGREIWRWNILQSY